MSRPVTSKYFKKVNATMSTNSVNKNVTSSEVATGSKSTLTSKYFQNRRLSLAPWVTTPTSIETKSISQKIKSISENVAAANSVIVTPISSRVKTVAERVSFINKEIVTSTSNAIENIIDSVPSVNPEIITLGSTDIESLSSINRESKTTTSSEIKSNVITTNIEIKSINKKAKKTRFDGVPENRILEMTLPDLITANLDLLIIGINPGLETAYRQHYYAGPGNHFWQCMTMAGFFPHALTAEDDAKLQDIGIGFTNVVERTTRGSADLKKQELVEGCVKLKAKIVKYKPKIVAFNGKYIFEIFSGDKKFSLGLQPGVIAEGVDTFQFVMPSSSARCSHLPRAQDKLPFFKGLKKMLDFVRGDIDEVEDEDVKFPDLKLTTGKKRKKAQW